MRTMDACARLVDFALPFPTPVAQIVQDVVREAEEVIEHMKR